MHSLASQGPPICEHARSGLELSRLGEVRDYRMIPFHGSSHPLLEGRCLKMNHEEPTSARVALWPGLGRERIPSTFHSTICPGPGPTTRAHIRLKICSFVHATFSAPLLHAKSVQFAVESRNVI